MVRMELILLWSAYSSLDLARPDSEISWLDLPNWLLEATLRASRKWSEHGDSSSEDEPVSMVCLSYPDLGKPSATTRWTASDQSTTSPHLIDPCRIERLLTVPTLVRQPFILRLLVYKRILRMSSERWEAFCSGIVACTRCFDAGSASVKFTDVPIKRIAPKLVVIGEAPSLTRTKPGATFGGRSKDIFE